VVPQPVEAAGRANNPFSRWWQRARAELARVAEEASKHAPHPVEVHWHKRKLVSLELASPLLAVQAADLDGDGQAEFILLTTSEVVVAAPRTGKRYEVIAQMTLPGVTPSLRPRDPVGALLWNGGSDGGGEGAVEVGQAGELRARTSEQAEGVVLAWKAGTWVERGRFAGFPLCGRATVELVAGRNYFDGGSVRWNGVRQRDLPVRFYSAICRSGLRDADGFSIEAFASVNGDRDLAVSCVRRDGSACRGGSGGERSYGGVGYALEVADIDNDGSPEVISSRGQAPGDSDQVTVYSHRGRETKTPLRENFQGGVVALTSGDIDGDGALEVVAAVRLLGSNRVDLWVLNQ
jgi:hypothetical protein